MKMKKHLRKWSETETMHSNADKTNDVPIHRNSIEIHILLDFSSHFFFSIRLYFRAILHLILWLRSVFSFSILFHTRLSPMNMPDYAEVAGCSTFQRKNATSPLYDSFGAYATTNLVRNANAFTVNNFPLHSNKKSNNSVYSAPTIHNFNTNDGHNFVHSDTNFPMHKTASKMNIIENKIDVINNLNRSASPLIGIGGVGSVNNNVTHSTSIGGTMRRNRLPKVGHCDKISFGGSDNGRQIDQPLFIKSKEDGSWTSVQNSAYHFAGNSERNNSIDSGSKHKTNDNISNNVMNGTKTNGNGSNNGIGGGNTSQIFLSSFGRADKV